jgi:hypothetical protein
VFYDGVEACKDPNLFISAYYARLNLLNELLSPMAAETLDLSWKHAGEREMKELRRSAMVGAIASDLIRALGIREILSGSIAPGQWFVHSGATYFTRQGYERKQATIKLSGGRSITGIVRRDCEITGTADANMDGRDEASFILCRLQTDSKFDLVVAGNRRDPLLGVFLAQPDVRSISLAPPLENVIDLIDYDSETQSGDDIFRISGFGDWQFLVYAVRDALGRFKRAVEQEGAWRQLYNPDMKSAHESRHQGAFRLCARSTFYAYGIKFFPGVDFGTGETDFTLSLREAIHIIEFKKDYDKRRLIHGLARQLPSYLNAAGAQAGTYAVMCHEHDPMTVKEWLEPVRESAEAAERVLLDLEVIDCRPQESASRKR